MFPLEWTVWCLLLSAPLTLCSLDIIEANGGVTCSQGLNCTMKNGSPFDANSVKVTDLSPQVKLCCMSRPTCALCLLIQVEVDLDKPGEEEGNSGLNDDEGSAETKDDEAETGSVTVCYKIPEVAVPSCKKAEFTVNQARPSQQSLAQISMVITKAWISYGNVVSIYLPNAQDIIKQVHVPYKVCFSKINTYVQECNVPKLNIRINKDNHVELSYPGENSSIPVICLQNETNGICKLWDRRPIPLESLPPCTCFQDWKENGHMIVHSIVCPFKNNTSLWNNFTVSVEEGRLDNLTMLWWKVSAPCRLQGEVWACERAPGPSFCSERQRFRQKLENDSWLQNEMGLWEKSGVFEQIDLKNSPCLMIKIGEMEKGPFCYNNINRWRWSLFAVAVMLLLFLTLLITFCLQDFIKKSVRRWRGFHKTFHQAHVLVLSPPDSDEEVSAEVSELGSLLWSEPRLLSVNVDQWSRKDQLNWGPLPWSHCQLLGMNSRCERVVLVLTPKAVERAQTWSSQDSPIVCLQEDSPYSDVFWASLVAIQAHKNQGRASDRFVLVTFESLWTDTKICHNQLPEILQGLPLFHLPSQTKALLSDLCGKKDSSETVRGRWTFSRKKIKNQEASLETETRLLQLCNFKNSVIVVNGENASFKC